MVCVVAVPPPFGIVMVRFCWLVLRVRVGAADAVARLSTSVVAARTKKVTMPNPREDAWDEEECAERREEEVVVEDEEALPAAT